MKKKIGILLMMSSLVLTAATAKNTPTPSANLTFDQRYDAISGQLDALRSKDEQRYQLEEQKALKAQDELDKQLALRDELQTKYDEAKQLAKVKVYSSEYKGVAAQYGDLLKKLDTSIKQNEGIINNFEKIREAREAFVQ